MSIQKKVKNRIGFFLILLVLGIASATAQKMVSGRVTDEKQEPLQGVSVAVKGTSQGTITDMDGKYTISAPNVNSILLFSYIGFEPRELPVGTQTTIDVKLKENVSGLDEVVVVAYGVQKKANLTGAVSSLKINDVKDIPVSNTASLLQGRMSGVTVSSYSAQPGKDDDVEIRIRGIGTFGNNNPLILIDGVEGTLSSVAPNDIESISVLKDAASAAIYGVRAANGVILVTTKRGTGANKISYSGSYGIQSATVLPKFLDSWQWATLKNEENNILGGTYPDYNYTDNMIKAMYNGSDAEHFANTNWMKEIFRSAAVQNHYISMSGGGQESNYLASIGYVGQDGIMKGTDTERLNFRLNAESKYLNRVTLGINTAGSYQKVTEPIGGTWNIFAKVVDATKPTVPVKYNNGEWGQYDGNPEITDYQSNPVEMTTYPSDENTYKFDGKFFLDIEPVTNLHIKSSFAYQHIQDNSSSFEPTYYHYKADGTFITDGIPTQNEGSALYRQWINENIITYNFNLNKAHVFNLLLGESNQYNGNKYSSATGQEFLNEKAHVMDNAQNTSANGYEEEATLRSLFGRINYAFKNRYLLEVNLRRDESSRIPKKNRTGYFPSISAGWNIAEEKFMQNQNLVNLLKLRASWGQLGNQDIGFYPYDQTYSVGVVGINYVWGDTKISGAALAKAANPNIKWETTTTANVGLDATFLKNKINLTADFFNKVSSNILLQLPISALYGVSEAPYVNAAKVKNTGWELNLGYNDRWNNFSYGANLNLSYVNNEIVSVNGRENWIDGWTINLAGNPIGAYYGYQADGLYTSQQQIDGTPVGIGSPRIGDIHYLDISGQDGKPDGKISDSDRTVIGNPFPKITYGFNLTAGYRQFDFAAFFQGIGKVDRVIMDRPAVGGGITDRMWDRYNEAFNPNGQYPEFGSVDYNSLPSSFWIKKASYMRLKNIELGYSFAPSFISKASIERLRLFVSAQNLFTLTGIKNYDPEKYASDSRNWTYPNAKTISVGVNINL